MRKKKQKSHEEQTAENYFPVDEEDLKHTIEKKVKEEIPVEKVELMKKIPKKRLYSKKRSFADSKFKAGSKKLTSKNKTYELPKFNLKKDGYELIVTEKPQAAMKIADALGKSEKRNLNGIPYYDVERDGKELVVACAVGHLFTLTQQTSGTPTFDIKWVPNFIARKKDFTKKYFDALLKLSKSAGSITIATDYDIEGEVIGLNVVRFICNQKDANRMKFSTLTPKELEDAYENKSPHLNWGQAIAGETRHYLDWFYGINLSRALMNAIKTTGKFRIMSIGRVQGPTLDLIVKKEREIQNFKSTPYWQVFIKVKQGKIELELKYIKDIIKKSDLKQFENLKGKTAEADTIKTQQIIPPNEPFNLTTLQTEAYKFFGITPSRTLQIAQSLYLAGLISYPRTSSQKLPDSINYREILQRLAREYKTEKLITRNKPVEGKKSDPAHPSIYPTGNIEMLSGEEEKIYNLIAKRFLALFCDDAIIDNKTVKAKVDGLVFAAKGSSVQKKGWMEIYPVKMQEKEIPDINGKVTIIDSRTEEKMTQPPRRYSPASIVSELEKRNLGTKSTRASILETLYDRNYIREKNIEATPFGMSLISSLEKYSPIIIDEKLTRHFETEMDSILQSKKDYTLKEEKIINEAKTAITKIIQDMSNNKEKIGNSLLEGSTELREKERQESIVGKCKKCGKGDLRILYNRNARRYFVACSAYPECRNTFSLPPNSLIKRADELCKECNSPMLLAIRKGKRPWKFCFNPECPVNKERIEEYNKKKEENSE